MSKGDKAYTAKDLFLKLLKLWKLSGNRKLVSLGRGFFEFEFSSLDDMRMAWAHGTMNLRPGVLRLSQWTKDFNIFTQHQTHAQVWIRLMDFPREYWRERIGILDITLGSLLT